MHLLHDLATGGFSVTREEVMAGRTPAGGWTRATLSSWGVPWPPRSGWIDRLTGGDRRRYAPAAATRSSSKAPCLAPNVSTDPRFTYRDPSITEPVYNGAAPPWDEPLGFGEVLWE